MKINTAELETVCGITSKLPVNDLPEVAFAGRSNVGKSSLINCVLGRRSLARTSAQPGKTQTLNFYKLNSAMYLVDLPGYGYAKTSKTEREKWGDMIARYLETSEMLRAVFLLLDIRHEPSLQDKQMYEYINYLELQPIVIATKADKLSRSQLDAHLGMIRKSLSADDELIIVPFSSVSGSGREEVLDFFDQIVENEGDNP
ncbi:MAG: YihA family ribosome biogenesis GTP-binding protein [Lachnospiraceae bacterium]|nr:YihA family ribosome biogenesis GTP-binding protein [Lachnospiraceae bacterium]